MNRPTGPSVMAMLIVLVILVVGVLCFIHWEIQSTKREVKEKAKQLVITPEKVDSTAKTAGRLLFEVKHFKKQVQSEMKRLEDSTERGY